MVVAQNVLDSLKQIGLNLYERKIWTALLSRGTASAGELSSLAKVPHSRTYDVLESLAEKGFVMIQNTKPLKYVAIEPSEALDRAKDKVTSDANLTIERISNVQSSPVLKELSKTFKQGVSLVEPGELTGSLKGRNAFHQQMGTVFKNAKKDIAVVTSGKGLIELHSKHGEALKRAAKRGVKVRIAAPVSKENHSALTELKKFAHIKKSAGSTGRFAVVDGNHMIVALTDEKTHPTQDFSLWTQSQHAAKDMMAPMFEALWGRLPNA